MTSALLERVCFVYSVALSPFMRRLPTPMTLLKTPPKSPRMYDVAAPSAPEPASMSMLRAL
jgi:hypothetical protein